MKIVLYKIIIFLIFISPAFSFTDQTTTERILKENKSFVDFLNVCITNYTDQEKLDKFKKIYETHFNGYISYLQARYKRTFKKVYSSQKEQVKLFKYLVNDVYLEDSKNILDKLAPMVIRSKNSRARLYLTLGYRDRTVARNNYVSGAASYEKLYSYKLYKFIKAIKKTRRAKRYGFLALFECQSDDVKREIYDHLLDSERKEGNSYFNRFLWKKGDIFLKELNLTYNEYKNSGEEEKLDKMQEGKKDDDEFEKKVERRVRFKYEKRAAEYLLFFKFDNANDIISKYVDDLNYKLISSTFEVLSNIKKGAIARINYDKFRIHHRDNHSRIAKKSAIETFVDTIKVEGDVQVKADSQDEEGIIKKTTDINENKSDTKTENIEDKEDKDKKTENKKNDIDSELKKKSELDSINN